ncbi:MAG: NADH-quinone oxidoreductase subunit L [Burkholderiales bacterium]|jgi:NADH-quinone oxidoreductase subunit L|nr:NADH-quinone oxidoreductase subunit L [Burkholderiales bacterium]
MSLLSLIVVLPLAGFLVNGLAGNRLGKGFVSAVGCGLPIVSFLITVKCFLDLRAGGYVPLVENAFTWATIGKDAFGISFYFDRLSAVMTLIVTGVGSLIHVYSTGYMHEDKSYARYFAYLNLFLFFMLLLVLGKSLLVLFVGWEGVGLASYLLIGFWFEDMEKARAGKKAFIVNRIGDAGFLLGMFVIYSTLGTLEMDRINAAFSATPIPAVSASLIAVLLFIGATGKSAQIPLYVWLPDAMAGPTPVSALIHAATMVTAGVYMIARLAPIYMNAPEASQLVAFIGAFTALFAATIAIAQTDIKKVLAYSTVSQLGFMFVALGVGAYGVAVFHVYTHAFFKACLFLGAGSVIHALSGEQDIRRMGGLASRIPVTFATFVVATAAIAGIPPLAGFFSKDEILWYAFASERGGSTLLWLVMSFTALLTAFYMFRLVWLTFFGRSRMSHEVEHHVHESPRSMTSVLSVLALLSAVGGFVSIPHFLEPQLPLPAVPDAMHHYEPLLIGIAVAIGFAGLAGAAYVYGGTGARAAGLRERFAGVHRLLYDKYYVDELYDLVIVRPLHWTSEIFLRVGDRAIIDGTLNGMAALAQRAAGLLGRVQTGSLHFYALLVLAGMVAVIVWSWRHV